MKQGTNNGNRLFATIWRVDRLWCVQVDGRGVQTFSTKKEAMTYAHEKGAFVKRRNDWDHNND